MSSLIGVDRLRLEALWDRLWSNYWFVPGLMTVLSGALAVIVAEIDHRYITVGTPFDFLLYGASAAGARAVLSTIAGSMITVAGVSFSVVLVALSQSASMFGPRLLPNFMRDRGNQVALGTFVATFVYCITLLMRVRGAYEEGEQFVPRLGVFIALLLALGSVAVLIYFLHHAATSIQVGHILRVAGRRLDRALDEIFPPREEHEEGEGDAEGEDDGERSESSATGESAELSRPRSGVRARGAGYVDAIDIDALVGRAREHDLDVVLHVRPGDHVVAGEVVAEIGPANATTDEVEKALTSEVVLSRVRGGSRDVLYRVEQLVDVAVRALSPGINDPLTAIDAVHRMAQSLHRMLDRPSVPPVHRDEDGRIRVVENLLSREEIVARAFTLIRRYGAGDPFVCEALLESLARLASHTTDEALRSCLQEQARAVRDAALATLEVDIDRDRIEEVFREMNRE